MEKKILNQQFLKYVLPSMFAMLLSGFYSIVDGLFVGNSVGDTALAAINIAYPIQVILNATAIGLGIGGSVMMTTFLGKKENEKADHALGSTVLLLIVCGICLSVGLYGLSGVLLHWLGASGVVYDQACEYIFVILTFGLLPVLGNGLNPLIRNYGKTIVATLCMSSGLVTNIILDYVFVYKFNMGLHGAALATVIAQGVVALSSILFLWFSFMKNLSWRSFLPNKDLVVCIVRIGVSPFGQTLIPCVITVLTNWMCIRYGGDSALTIYSVVCYVLASCQLLLQGIGDGIQPLLSYNYGKNDSVAIQYLYKRAFFLSCGFSLFLCALTCAFASQLAILFGVSEALIEGTRMALVLTSLSYPFIGIVRLTSAVFYATGRTKNSTFLIYLEPCALIPVCLIGFSSLFGLMGVWVAYPACQIVLCVLSLVLQSPNLVVNNTMYSQI